VCRVRHVPREPAAARADLGAGERWWRVKARHLLGLWALVYVAVFAFLWTIASGCGAPRVSAPCDMGPGYQVDDPACDSLVVVEG
jgi:hypothetical protein